MLFFNALQKYAHARIKVTRLNEYINFMLPAILVLNSGSSTLKFALFCVKDHEVQKLYSGVVDKITTKPSLKIKDNLAAVVLDKQLEVVKGLAQGQQAAVDSYELAINEILQWAQDSNVKIVAAGHRVVHGALQYRTPVVIDKEKLDFLTSLNHLAPLHQPYNVKGIAILREKYPHILQVACFDTAFHATCNELSQMFAIPKWLTEDGVRRYGFHGLSYEYIVTQFDKHLPAEKANGKVIVGHFGQGVSMCAISNKKSVATTLGFSTLDGLPMGTRCGSIDPGVLLYFMQHYKMSFEQLEKLLYRESGLLGVSGVSSDMRTLLASDSADAKLAVDLFIYKASALIGMLAAELGGLDSLVFTAGIGENAPYIRGKICEKMVWLGAKIDENKNERGAQTISNADSKISIHVIPTDEELMIARHTFKYYADLLH